MKKKVFGLMALVMFFGSSIKLNSLSLENYSLEKTTISQELFIDCNDVYDLYYEAAYFQGYSFGEALEIADAAETLCTLITIIGSYL